MQATWKILLLDPLSASGMERLRSEEGFEVHLKPQLSYERLKREIAQYDAVVVRSSTRMTAEILNEAKKLKIICRAGVGIDNIELGAATKRGVIVMNAPEANIITAAEHTIALLLALSRCIPLASQSVKEGSWDRKRFVGVEVYGKNLGIVGLGRIGRAVWKRARAFEMNLIGFDPYISAEAAETLGLVLVDFQELIERSDFISLHVPRTEETYHLIGAREFAKMKDGVRIINCARGGIIDEAALYEAIISGKVAGAALDVFQTEPPITSDLLSLDRVICTPHIGGATYEAQDRISSFVAEQLIGFLKRSEIKNAVNLPPIDAENYSRIKPYLELAEKLGNFLVQLTEGGIRGIKVKCSGEIVEGGLKAIAAAAVKGALFSFVEGAMNFVNARLLAADRGIKIEETFSRSPQNYSNLIEVEIVAEKNSASAAGTLFSKRDARIIRLEEYRLEAVPEGDMIVFSNADVPGLIGKVGTILGQCGANIGGMHLGRDAPRGKALCILNVDTPIPDCALDKIMALPEIFSAKKVKMVD